MELLEKELSTNEQAELTAYSYLQLIQSRNARGRVGMHENRKKRNRARNKVARASRVNRQN